MTTIRTAPLGVLAAALVLGCNPYDPNLGDRPFRCGTDSPRCPEGFSCVADEQNPVFEVCVREGASPTVDAGEPGAPDAMMGPFTCNDDSEIEPNDSTAAATTTPIPDQADTYRLVALAICPAGDVDVFRFRVDESGRNIRVEVEYTQAQGQLVLDILNSTGVSIKTGTQESPTLLSAEVANAPSGVYYAQVQADPAIPTTENNYNVEIITSGP